MQKLENDLWHDCESITAKDCTQQKAMSESHLETCIGWMNFKFQLKDILSNQALKIIIYSVIDEALTTHSWRYVKWQVLSFHLKRICFEVDDLLYENWAKFVWKENISTPSIFYLSKWKLKFQVVRSRYSWVSSSMTWVQGCRNSMYPLSTNQNLILCSNNEPYINT